VLRGSHQGIIRLPCEIQERAARFWFAAFNGTTWDIETVHTKDFSGMWISIALDAHDNPHISYWDFWDDTLWHAYKYCGYLIAGDLNNDCRVDLHDFAVMAANWLIDCNQTPGDPACVPK
jgi:hypothetical protein